MRIGIPGIWRISSFYFWATDNVIFGIGLIWTLEGPFSENPLPAISSNYRVLQRLLALVRCMSIYVFMSLLNNNINSFDCSVLEQSSEGAPTKSSQRNKRTNGWWAINLLHTSFEAHKIDHHHHHHDMFMPCVDNRNRIINGTRIYMRFLMSMIWNNRQTHQTLVLQGEFEFLSLSLPIAVFPFE